MSRIFFKISFAIFSAVTKSFFDFLDATESCWAPLYNASKSMSIGSQKVTNCRSALWFYNFYPLAWELSQSQLHNTSSPPQCHARNKLYSNTVSWWVFNAIFEEHMNHQRDYSFLFSTIQLWVACDAMCDVNPSYHSDETYRTAVSPLRLRRSGGACGASRPAM